MRKYGDIVYEIKVSNPAQNTICIKTPSRSKLSIIHSLI